MKFKITQLLAIVFLVTVGSVMKVNAQTTTFDIMNSNVGSQKTISWNTSIYGAGFGHRLISIDPGEFTSLNFQARHNSASWKDALVISSQGNVGFGNNNPIYPFHLKALANARSRFEYGTTTIDVVDYGAGTEDYSGSAGIWVNGSDALIMSGAGKGIRLVTYNGTTSTDRMRILPNGNVGINTKNPTYTLSVNGTIGTKEVNVTTTGWADYVFKADYELMPLSDVEAFIMKNGHLPNVPTEKDVVENGVNLLEMNVKLLEKVEELTLYVIELEKKIYSKDF